MDPAQGVAVGGGGYQGLRLAAGRLCLLCPSNYLSVGVTSSLHVRVSIGVSVGSLSLWLPIWLSVPVPHVCVGVGLKCLGVCLKV